MNLTNQTNSLIQRLSSSTTTTIRKHINLFPDFYDESYDFDKRLLNSSVSSNLFGLVQTDYDGSLIFDNGSSILNDYSFENDTAPFSSSQLISQLSTPLFYILFMLLVYVLIIFIVFMSAVYSHRKKVGFNYDEFYESPNGSDTELGIIKSKLVNSNTKNNDEASMLLANEETEEQNSSKIVLNIKESDAESGNLSSSDDSCEGSSSSNNGSSSSSDESSDEGANNEFKILNTKSKIQKSLSNYFKEFIKPTKPHAHASTSYTQVKRIRKDKNLVFIQNRRSKEVCLPKYSLNNSNSIAYANSSNNNFKNSFEPLMNGDLSIFDENKL